MNELLSNGIKVAAPLKCRRDADAADEVEFDDIKVNQKKS